MFAGARKLPFHEWFHAWEFEETNEQVQRRIAKVSFRYLNAQKI